MRTSGTRLQAVSEEEAQLIETSGAIPLPRESRTQAALTGLLLTTLTALSQKTVIALASLVDLLLISSAFALWFMVIREPTVLQLVGLAGYAAFIGGCLTLRMRRRVG